MIQVINIYNNYVKDEEIPRHVTKSNPKKSGKVKPSREMGYVS